MSEALGVLVAIVGLAAVIATCRLVVHLLRDWAEDRAREARLADQTVHRWNEHRHADRHDHSDHYRPE